MPITISHFHNNHRQCVVKENEKLSLVIAFSTLSPIGAWRNALARLENFFTASPHCAHTFNEPIRSNEEERPRVLMLKIK
jgi:hypothetical protein